MSDKIVTSHNPHDALFKASLQNISVARDFFKAHLPAELQDRVDLNTLKLHNNEFIDEKFRKHFCDVLYSAEIDKRPSYLYLLAEHQRTPDRFMAFRTLHYECKTLEQHLAQHKDCKQLPAIYGLVFYNGTTKPYPFSTQIKACFEDPEFATRYLLEGFDLIDITQVSDEEIAQHGLVSMMETLEKHADSRDLLVHFKRLLSSSKDFVALAYNNQLGYNIKVCAIRVGYKRSSAST